MFYAFDNVTRKQQSLQTRNKHDAMRLLHARNEAERQPGINLQIARAYLLASDPSIASRTWGQVMAEVARTKNGNTRLRWERAMRQSPFDLIRNLTLIESRPEHFLKVLGTGTISTNIFLRRLHNFALDLGWLPVPLIPRRRWPRIQFDDKRAITWEEHQKILAGERNAELRDYYELLWHLGASQTDLASLHADNIDWTNQTISYTRRKTGSHPIIRFGATAARILQVRPEKGCLFPMISRWSESDRGSIFSRRCKRVGVRGVSLHSYRYAWAERARTCGFPERFAQEALGHGSKAVARAYAKKAQVLVPCLEEYEKKIVPLPGPVQAGLA